MSGQSSGSRQRFAGSHQRSWLWGRHAVTEVLRAGRWPVLELLLSRLADVELRSVCREAAVRQGVRLREEDNRRITQLCGHADHQGLAAQMAPFPVGTADQLLAGLQTRDTDCADRPALVLICDRIQDAFNFGAILRNCDAAAVDAVVIASQQQARVTPHVARASSGAVNFLELFEVDDLVAIVQQLRSRGFTVFAASEKPAPPGNSPRRPGHAALVIGSESTGVSPPLLQECDDRLTIPMLGHVGSLNAAVASGILLYELRRRQDVVQFGITR